MREKYRDFSYSKSFIKDIIQECDYQKYGARRIDKVIEKNLGNITIEKNDNYYDKIGTI